jgi:hypothetical protein
MQPNHQMVADMILRIAEIEQTNLIAMSTHGRKGLLRLLLEAWRNSWYVNQRSP